MTTTAKRTRRQKWEDSLREYAKAGDYAVWRIGYRARNADQEFIVYPASATREQILARDVRAIFWASTYAKLLAKWNDSASWTPR